MISGRNMGNLPDGRCRDVPYVPRTTFTDLKEHPMSVLAIFAVKGDTDDLLARYDDAMPRITEVSPSKPLSHICTPAEDGIRIYDVWPSVEVLEDFSQNPKFVAAIQEAGLPMPEVSVVPVHQFNW